MGRRYFARTPVECGHAYDLGTARVDDPVLLPAPSRSRTNRVKVMHSAAAMNPHRTPSRVLSHRVGVGVGVMRNGSMSGGSLTTGGGCGAAGPRTSDDSAARPNLLWLVDVTCVPTC